jgi:hypothetical protein
MRIVFVKPLNYNLGQKSNLIKKFVNPVWWVMNSTHDRKVVGSNLVSSKILDEMMLNP